MTRAASSARPPPRSVARTYGLAAAALVTSPYPPPANV